MNISIKKEAYEFLKSLKSKDKSFSDVILGFKKKDSILDFFGALKDKDWDKAERQIGSLRKSLSKRLG